MTKLHSNLGIRFQRGGAEKRCQCGGLKKAVSGLRGGRGLQRKGCAGWPVLLAGNLQCPFRRLKQQGAFAVHRKPVLVVLRLRGPGRSTKNLTCLASNGGKLFAVVSFPRAKMDSLVEVFVCAHCPYFTTTFKPLLASSICTVIGNGS